MYIRLIRARTYHLTWVGFALASERAWLFAVVSADIDPPSKILLV
jgi:hypothetical protein